MNKRLNTVLFILGATAFNILITLLSFFLLLFVCGRIIMPLLPEQSYMWIVMIVFIGAMAIAFVVYRYSLRFLLKKVDMEKYFDPLFVNRHRPKA